MADKAKTPPPPKKGPQKSAGGSKRNLRLILIIGIVAAVVVAGGLIALSQRGGTADDGANAAEVEAGKLKGTKQVQDFFAGVPQNGNTLGDPNAPVTVTEFADLRCPVCKAFAEETGKQMIGTFVKPGKAKYVYRNWPILGPDSVSATQCAIAAQQQNQLFQYLLLLLNFQQPQSILYQG